MRESKSKQCPHPVFPPTLLITTLLSGLHCCFYLLWFSGLNNGFPTISDGPRMPLELPTMWALVPCVYDVPVSAWITLLSDSTGCSHHSPTVRCLWHQQMWVDASEADLCKLPVRYDSNPFDSEHSKECQWSGLSSNTLCSLWCNYLWDCPCCPRCILFDY